MPPFKTLLRRSLYKTFLLPDKSCGSILLNIIIIGSIIFPILGSNLGHSPLSIITFRYLLFVNIGHQMISSMFNVLWHLQRKFLHFQLPSKVHQELQYLRLELFFSVAFRFSINLFVCKIIILVGSSYLDLTLITSCYRFHIFVSRVTVLTAWVTVADCNWPELGQPAAAACSSQRRQRRRSCSRREACSPALKWNRLGGGQIMFMESIPSL